MGEGGGDEREWEPDPEGELIARDEASKTAEGVELRATLGYYRTADGKIVIRLEGASGRPVE